MANTKQAKKRVRQGVKRRARTQTLRSMMRTSLKKAVAAIATKSVDTAQSAYAEAARMVDKMVSHGIIHKNKAARHKSRLNEQVKNLKSA